MPEKEGEEEKVVKTTSNTSLNVNFLSGPAQAICDTPPLHSLTDHTHIKSQAFGSQLFLPTSGAETHEIYSTPRCDYVNEIILDKGVMIRFFVFRLYFPHPFF